MKHKFKKLETTDHMGMVWVDEVCIYCATLLYRTEDTEFCAGGNIPNSYTSARFINFLDNL